MGKITDPVSQEAKSQQDRLYEGLGHRVQAWRTHLPKDRSCAQCDIENELCLSKGRIGKIESASTPSPNLYELVKLSKTMGITCDELITGVPPQLEAFHEQTGLSVKAIRELEQYNKKYPDYIRLINNIFEDENISISLLESLLLYASCDLLEIKIAEMGNGYPIHLDTKKQEGLSQSLSLIYLQSVLEKIRRDWNTAVIWPGIERAADKALDSVRLSLAERIQRLDNYQNALNMEIEEENRQENEIDDEP